MRLSGCLMQQELSTSCSYCVMQREYKHEAPGLPVVLVQYESFDAVSWCTSWVPWFAYCNAGLLGRLSACCSTRSESFPMLMHSVGSSVAMGIFRFVFTYCGTNPLGCLMLTYSRPCINPAGKMHEFKVLYGTLIYLILVIPSHPWLEKLTAVGQVRLVLYLSLLPLSYKHYTQGDQQVRSRQLPRMTSCQPGVPLSSLVGKNGTSKIHRSREKKFSNQNTEYHLYPTLENCYA